MIEFPEELKNRSKKNYIDHNQLISVIPHRDPVLLVDDIIDYEAGKWAIGHRHLTGEEAFWKGHFPGKRMMPGTYQLEALSQVAVFVILSDKNCNKKTGIFAEAKDVRFYEMVLPGDDITLYCYMEKSRMGIYRFTGFGSLSSNKDCIFANMTLTLE